MKSVPLLRGLAFVAYFHLLSMAVGSHRNIHLSTDTLVAQ